MNECNIKIMCIRNNGLKVGWLTWLGYSTDTVIPAFKKVKEVDVWILGKAVDTQLPSYNHECIRGNNAVKELFNRISYYDIIIVDGYYFSIGHRPEIQPWTEKVICDYDEWGKMQGKTFLLDLESDAGGQEDWYLDHKDKFTHVITSNRKLSDKIFPRGFNPVPIENCPPMKSYKERSIKISMTGSHMDCTYRTKLCERIESIGGYTYPMMSEAEYLALLNESRNYYASLVAPGASKEWIGAKGKVYEAAYMGARPVVEDNESTNAFYQDMCIIDKGCLSAVTESDYDPEKMREWALEHTWSRIFEKVFEEWF